MTKTDVTDVTTKLQERFDHFPGLTPKQAKFAQLIVLYEGRKTATQLAIESGFSEKTARQQASNMQNPKMFPKVVDAIQHYRVQFYRKYETSYDKHLKRMYELSSRAEEAGNWNAAVAAEKNRGQVAGLYIDKKEIKVTQPELLFWTATHPDPVNIDEPKLTKIKPPAMMRNKGILAKNKEG